jgi:predicted permease
MAHFKAEELTGLYERLLEAVLAVPGVERAALSDITPASGSARIVPIVTTAADLPDSERLAFVNVVSPGWLATYGTTLLAGRDFEAADRAETARVGIVNEAFARRFLNGDHPVGRTIRTGFGAGTPIEIVGYARDAVYRSLRDPAPPTLYTAFAQRPIARPFVTITVRTSTDAPAALSQSLVSAIGKVSPEPDLWLQPLSEQVSGTLARERVVAMLATFFGFLALLLAGLGLYGVTSHLVRRRWTEIGIRVALGAQHSRIVRMMLRRVAVLVVSGLATGFVLSWWAARFISATLLYGLGPRDPGTFAAAAALLALVGIAAGWIPARRAARVDPMTALRTE